MLLAAVAKYTQGKGGACGAKVDLNALEGAITLYCRSCFLPGSVTPRHTGARPRVLAVDESMPRQSPPFNTPPVSTSEPPPLLMVLSVFFVVLLLLLFIRLALVRFLRKMMMVRSVFFIFLLLLPVSHFIQKRIDGPVDVFGVPALISPVLFFSGNL